MLHLIAWFCWGFYWYSKHSKTLNPFDFCFAGLGGIVLIDNLLNFFLGL